MYINVIIIVLYKRRKIFMSNCLVAQSGGDDSGSGFHGGDWD